MKPHSPKPSFEMLHLISSLLVKLNSVYETCGLVEQQAYILAYLDWCGEKTQTADKLLLRTKLTDVLKEVFKCNDNQVSKWVNGLLRQGLLGEVTLDKKQIQHLSSGKKGSRSKGVFLEKQGSKKLTFFVDELVKFRSELINQRKSILLPPGAVDHGTVGKVVLVLLAGFEAT